MPRGKTFTGCWTCRERRLKCDEVRPKCNKCSSKGLLCAGYGTRLHWLDSANSSPPESSHATAGKSVQRRRLLPANGIERLSDDQLDSLLFQVDEDSTCGQQCFHGPFGSFPSIGDAAILEQTRIVDSAIFSKATARESVSAVDSSARSSDDITSLISMPNPRRSDRSRDGRPIATHASPHPTGSYSLSVPQGTPASERSPLSHLSTTSPSFHTALDIRTTPVYTPLSGADTTGSAHFLTAKIRVLLNHYRTNVLPFFSVMDNMHTPWRILHFPKVLQAACEHELGYTTAGSSSILMYAILSISAYSLQNSESKKHNGKLSRHWEEIAAHYRGEALKLLQAHIANLSDDRTESDYHELLAAILSMVSIDVMCGDTRTCEVHLKACETLINVHVKANPDRLSTMSEALHTTFIYLQVMQSAATASIQNARRYSSSSGSPEEVKSPGNARRLLTPIDYTTFINLGDAKHVSFTSFSSEMIYGFPVRLLFCLHCTIQTTDCSILSATFKRSAQLQRRIDGALDNMGEEILGFPVEEIIAKYRSAPLKEGNLKIMEHYTRAFHLSLVIYFLDQARQVPLSSLQQHVESIIDHLEQVEEVKKEHGIIAGPLLWPAFVAASRATDVATRSRFIDWLEGSDQMGVGTSKATIDLLKEIWSNAPTLSAKEARYARSQRGLVLT